MNLVLIIFHQQRWLKIFKASTLTLTLKEYSRHRSIGSTFDPNEPHNFYGNVKAVDRGGCAMAAVFIHECIHALSYHTPTYDFSHDNDDPSENQGTAPYWIQRHVRNKYCGQSALEKDDELLKVEVRVTSDKEE